VKSSDRFFVDGVKCRYDGAPHPVANLSVGGFFVATPRVPMKGQVLDLELQLGKLRTFRILGTVTWVNDGSRPEQPAGFGVKITKIDLGDKVALIDLLRRAEEGSAPGRPART
jgi:Tfp pilus assembly protein PilZ